MFWKYNTGGSSQIDTLLAKEDVTLQEVMDSEDIINECRVQNKNLIDFLLKPNIIEELVNLTTKEPSADIEERNRFKYPNIASELLTCDVPSINERLASDEGLLEKLYVFLEGGHPLNPLLASYFSKIMGALIAKKTEQVLDFLKARESFLPLLLKHMGTSAIMDLTLKLMTQVEGVEMKQNILNWLDSQQIIQKLIELLNPQVEKERHDNVSHLLCDFIRTARDNLRNSTERADPDPLLNTLESPDTVCLLLNQMFDKEKCDSSIVGGIQILLSLLDVNQSNFHKYSMPNIYSSNINEEAIDLVRKQITVQNTTDAICTRLKDFHNLLLEPPKQSAIPTTAGLLDPPLGSTRLAVVKLLSNIQSENTESNAKLYEELMKLGTYQVLLDLFFKYSWNNFLHTQVENCLEKALKTCSAVAYDEQNTNALCTHLIVDCKLIDRLLTVWQENDEQIAEGKIIRPGYMGHVTSLVTTLTDLASSSSFGKWLLAFGDTASRLEQFGEGTLAETKKLQDTILGGALPNTSTEVSDDFNDNYGLTPALQQMQNFSGNYSDDYGGFGDDPFNDRDEQENLHSVITTSVINDDLSETDLVQGDEIFRQMCSQNVSSLFDAEDQIFDDKDHSFKTVIEKGGDRNEVCSSDSEDESPGDENMDVDPWSSPKPADTASAVSTDPWNLSPQSGNAEFGGGSGWADFSHAGFEANLPSVTAEKKDDFTSHSSSNITMVYTANSMNKPADEKPPATSKEPSNQPTEPPAEDDLPTEPHASPSQYFMMTGLSTANKDGQSTNLVEATPTVDAQLSSTVNQPSCEEISSQIAAGDQIMEIKEDNKEAMDSSVAEPSIAREGDTCKSPQSHSLPEKPQHSPENSEITAKQPENV